MCVCVFPLCEPCCLCSLFGGRAEKVIDQHRRSWQTLRTLLGVAPRGHHSGSRRNNNSNNRNSPITIKKQLAEEPATKMVHRKQLLGGHRNGMLITMAPAVAIIVTTITVEPTTITRRIRTTRTRTPIMKSVIVSASKIPIVSRKIRCAAGVRSRKVCVTTGAAGRNRSE